MSDAGVGVKRELPLQSEGLVREYLTRRGVGHVVETLYCPGIVNIVIVIALCLQYHVLKGYPRKFLELLTSTPPQTQSSFLSFG